MYILLTVILTIKIYLENRKWIYTKKLYTTCTICFFLITRCPNIM